MDLVVILWRTLFHGLGCLPMEKFLSHGLGCCPVESFCSMDLAVVLWKSLFSFCCHRLGCCLMDTYIYIYIYIYIYVFLCRRLDCRLTVVSFPVDLVIALRRISGLMDLVVVL
jgi:hypothetical protein